MKVIVAQEQLIVAYTQTFKIMQHHRYHCRSALMIAGYFEPVQHLFSRVIDLS